MEALIKIAYLIDTISSDKAGTEKQLLELIRRLDKRKFDPILICLYTSPWMHSHDLPCRHYELEYTGFLKPCILKTISRFAAIIKEQDVKVTQTFFEDSIFVGFGGALISFKDTVLISSRRDMGLGKENLWYHKLFKIILRFVNLKFDSIVTNSNVVREYVSDKEKTPLNKIRVIPNGIDIPEDTCDKPRLFIDHKADFWIGITANLKPVKRIDVFLKAVAFFKEKSSINFHAIVLGEGRDEVLLKDIAHNLGLSSNVHFLGSVDNVYAYLRHLDVGVLCSDSEGLSNAIMEYMACGLPVVATSVGGNTELVDEENGFVVPKGDFIALGSALLTLTEDPAMKKRKGLASLNRIKEKYSWNKIMAEWETFYQTILNNK